MLDTEIIAKAISKANEGKQAYIFQFEDGTYFGQNKYKVKTKRSALRLIDPDYFKKHYPEEEVTVISVLTR